MQALLIYICTHTQCSGASSESYILRRASCKCLWVDALPTLQIKFLNKMSRSYIYYWSKAVTNLIDSSSSIWTLKWASFWMPFWEVLWHFWSNFQTKLIILLCISHIHMLIHLHTHTISFTQFSSLRSTQLNYHCTITNIQI